MPRFAVKCDIPTLKAHLTKALQDSPESGTAEEFETHSLTNLNNRIGKDFTKVKFDFENSCRGDEEGDADFYELHQTLGWHTLDNGFSFLGCIAGGDWEHPVFFIIYWSGKEIRAYIPEDGNPFDRQTRSALGNGDTEADDGEFDETLLLADIRKRIELTDEKNVAFAYKFAMSVSKQLDAKGLEEFKMEMQPHIRALKNWLKEKGWQYEGEYFEDEGDE